QADAKIGSGRIEQCVRAITVGVDENGNDSLAGIAVDTMSFEANNWHIYINACLGGDIRNIGNLGGPFIALENVPGNLGIHFKTGATRMVLESMLVEGAFQDACIKFEDNGTQKDRLVFMGVQTNLNLDQVDPNQHYPNARNWKGVASLGGNATFIQCNQS